MQSPAEMILLLHLFYYFVFFSKSFLQVFCSEDLNFHVFYSFLSPQESTNINWCIWLPSCNLFLMEAEVLSLAGGGCRKLSSQQPQDKEETPISSPVNLVTFAQLLQIKHEGLLILIWYKKDHLTPVVPHKWEGWCSLSSFVLISLFHSYCFIDSLHFLSSPAPLSVSGSQLACSALLPSWCFCPFCTVSIFS